MAPAERSISARVISAVERTSGTDAGELPPLQNAIETDALDALYAHANAAAGDRTVPTVLFSYAGYEIHVRSATDIEVREPIGGADDSTPN